MPKIVYLVKTLRPYRVPLFFLFQRFVGHEATFLFDEAPGPEELDMLRATPLTYQVVRGIHISKVPFVQPRFRRQIPIGLIGALVKIRPSIIVCPEYSLETILASLYSLAARCKLVIWCSLTLADERVSFYGQRLIRKLLRRRADAFVCYSKSAIEYLSYHGIPTNRCFLVENCSDVQYFLSKSSPQRSVSSDSLHLLYVGALVKEKGLLDLFEALRDLSDNGWDLTIAGNGPLLPTLQSFVSEMPTGQVRFVGTVCRNALPSLYQSADVLICPSHSDVWGHVIDEAMATGCCVLSSTRTVAAIEHIKDGWNGMIFPAGDVIALKRRIADLIGKPEMAWQMGVRARTTMVEHNEELSARGMLDSIAYVEAH